MIKTSTDKKNIALCLSGGGFRAIAFQLGCLRALHRQGILDKVKIISTVSGGAIIGGMLAYSDDSFEDFERRVNKLLRKGITRHLFQRIFLSPRLLGSVATFIFSGIAAFAADISRAFIAYIARKTGRFDWRNKPKFMDSLHPPFRRWWSRSSSFEDVLRFQLFGRKKIADKRRNGLDIVFNSCDLKTGEPFRFSNRRSGCGRFGDIKGNDIEVAHAVAASAMYPIFFPAMDKKYDFENSQGEVKSQRVFLVDGGVFDNLGIACLEPERMPYDNYGIFSADYIICCTAGQGEKKSIPYWLMPRLIRVSDVISRKLLNIHYQALKRYKAQGTIKEFILAYLAQEDSELEPLPADMVRKEEVQDYPTNFFPMKQADIDLISRRGEQIMDMLIKRGNISVDFINPL